MGEIIEFKAKVRVDSIELERHLRYLEKIIPYLRKHIKELVENPTELHLQQVTGTLDSICVCGDYLRFYSISPFKRIINASQT